jgi:hypothetical protein
MQKPHECELTTHIGPESCGAAPKSSVDRSMGTRAMRGLEVLANSVRGPVGQICISQPASVVPIMMAEP